MVKSFRYRLYPSTPQERLLERTLETCRRWYDQCLAERRDCLSLDRDHNAAINILNRAGQVRWASSSPGDGLAQEAARL